MNTDIEPTFRQLAEDEAAAEAFARGELTFAYDPTAPAPQLPPRLEGEPMVVMSVRVPTSTYLAIQVEAGRRGIKPSAVAREWLELQRADQEPDRVVALSDVKRAMLALREASSGSLAGTVRSVG